MTLQDYDPMPFGKYKGEKMIKVPAGYLLWLLENNKCGGSVKRYIEDNIEAIKKEMKKS